ncbi:hypothetical protein Nepgr_004619 [Nepenthes gracilis]|uniref:Uncharacterized protein n=1 Tax=Nepenthes gracilis TaxID=150966 RepID=A0AAD3S1M9_NEPGR|nr:hypothetical protein Nepgr_004619 [Nepenthes gracilis]
MATVDLLRKLSVLVVLIVSASVIPTSSSAARRSWFVIGSLARDDAQAYEEKTVTQSEEKTEATIHERLLRMNHGDYGRYNPTPALAKPRFKLIPD